MFKQLLIFSLVLGLISHSKADLFNPEPNIFLDGVTYSFTQSILDEGYDPSVDTIERAVLDLNIDYAPTDFFQVGDGIYQEVDVYLDGLFFNKFTERYIGIDVLDIDLLSLGAGFAGILDDGLLDVTLISTAGADLFFDMSRLDVSYSSPITTQVFEPSTLLLMSLGLAGIGFSRRKKTT